MVKAFHHQETKRVPFSADQLYGIVKDVLSYPEFLPWCLSARIVEQQDIFFVADLMVGFKNIHETFRSVVHANDAKKEITTRGTGKGPLSTMDNHWRFIAVDDGHCDIEFSVTISFSSFIIEKLFAPFFNESIKKMTTAFLQRAHDLYG